MLPTQALMCAVYLTLRINKLYERKTQTKGVGVIMSEYKSNI